MADNDLSRNYFPILRIGKIIEAGKAAPVEAFGYFSCRASVTRYLVMEELIAVSEAVVSVRRKAFKRSATLADGTELTVGAADKAEGGTTSKIEEEQAQLLLSNSSRGSKTVKLKTTKLVDPAVKGKYHQVSFRFPGWATNLIISNALGLILPSGTIASPIQDGKIFPYFISPGGRRYPIATSTAAQEANVALVGTSSSKLKEMLTDAGANAQVEAAQE
ncbi:MAG: hypothetical protein ACYTXA_24705 [Nostoc sp.]